MWNARREFKIWINLPRVMVMIRVKVKRLIKKAAVFVDFVCRTNLAGDRLRSGGRPGGGGLRTPVICHVSGAVMDVAKPARISILKGFDSCPKNPVVLK